MSMAWVALQLPAGSGSEKLCTPYSVPDTSENMYPRNQLPRILETKYNVPQAQDCVPSALDTTS